MSIENLEVRDRPNVKIGQERPLGGFEALRSAEKLQSIRIALGEKATFPRELLANEAQDIADNAPSGEVNENMVDLQATRAIGSFAIEKSFVALAQAPVVEDYYAATFKSVSTESGQTDELPRFAIVIAQEAHDEAVSLEQMRRAIHPDQNKSDYALGA